MQLQHLGVPGTPYPFTLAAQVFLLAAEISVGKDDQIGAVDMLPGIGDALDPFQAGADIEALGNRKRGAPSVAVIEHPPEGLGELFGDVHI